MYAQRRRRPLMTHAPHAPTHPPIHPSHAETATAIVFDIVKLIGKREQDFFERVLRAVLELVALMTFEVWQYDYAYHHHHHHHHHHMAL